MQADTLSQPDAISITPLTIYCSVYLCPNFRLSLCVFVPHLVLVVPEDEGGGLRAELDAAGKGKAAPRVYVDIRLTVDHRLGLCSTK